MDAIHKTLIKHFHKILACFLAGLPLITVVYSQDKSLPYKNEALSFEERTDDLIARMTLQEKVSQLFNESPAIPRLDIPAYNWWNECLHGVARAGKATVFPQAIGLAATFDEQLMQRIGTAVSDEARAKHHYFTSNNARGIYMGLTFWTPNINIFRDPRWGRGQETYGEDPFLTGRMAVNFIRALQGDDPKYLKTIATAKHYAVHSGPEFTRHNDNIFVNDRDLYETFLPAFRATVVEANVQSVMCAYNRFRDKPCCGNDFLLSGILRKEFGFSGYIVSDCGAITDFYNDKAHHVVAKPENAWGWSIASGTDLNCEESRAFLTNIDAAVKAGIVNEADINKSLKRLLMARFRLGMFDDQSSQTFTKIPMDVVGSEKHLNLSREAAEKSFVLLKNDGILPLKKNKRIALIGPNANNLAVLTANYNGDPINPITPLSGLKNFLGVNNVLYSPGTPIVPGVFTDYQTIGKENFFHDEKGKLKPGLIARYYANDNFTGIPSLEQVDAQVNFKWEKSPITKRLDDPFAVRWSGLLIPAESGTYKFGGNVIVKIDHEVKSGEVALKKGVRYILEVDLVVKAFWWASNYQQQFASLTWVETSKDYFNEALSIARKADVVVFCGGISANLEGEEMPLEIDGFAHGDRTHIELPQVQTKLLSALRQLGKPIIYVNFSGSAIALNWQQANVNAIVQAFYPGETTGIALARLLFGEFSPAGRLPVTFYKSINDIPDFKDYRMAGKTYRYFKGEPLYGFGYGLSYTTFKYDSLTFLSRPRTGDSLAIAVRVTNTGPLESDEVVQIYLASEDAGVPVPIRSLVAFKRVHLMRNQSQVLTFKLRPEAFSIVDETMSRVIKPGNFHLSAGGKQPDPSSTVSGQVLDMNIELRGETIKLIRGIPSRDN
jgi:beta-glucosidase